MAVALRHTEANVVLYACVSLINRCKLFAGLVDADVSTSPTDIATLTTNLQTRRDAAGQRPEFKLLLDQLIFWLQRAYQLGILTDTLITNLLTVSGTSATTDLRYNFTNDAMWDTSVPVTYADDVPCIGGEMTAA